MNQGGQPQVPVTSQDVVKAIRLGVKDFLREELGPEVAAIKKGLTDLGQYVGAQTEAINAGTAAHQNVLAEVGTLTKALDNLEEVTTLTKAIQLDLTKALGSKPTTGASVPTSNLSPADVLIKSGLTTPTGEDESSSPVVTTEEDKILLQKAATAVALRQPLATPAVVAVVNKAYAKEVLDETDLGVLRKSFGGGS